MRKGFTLIELLATIVILAVVSIITIPIVINIVEKARLGIFKDSMYGLLDAGNLYYARYGTGDMLFVCNGEECKDEKNNKLLFKGRIPDSGEVILNKDGTQELNYVSEGKYCALGNRNNLKVSIGCNSLDPTRPEL